MYQISRELGLTQNWRVVIVGVGNLGHALAGYGGFASRGFTVAALLDSDERRIGERIAGLVVRPVTDLEQVVRERNVHIGVVATPAESAQGVCDRLVAAGVTSVLNFAPCVLDVPDHVLVRKVDLSTELQILAFHEQRRLATRLAAEAPAETRPTRRTTARRPRADHRGGAAMSELVVGLSYRTAPIGLLERAALGDDAARALEARLLRQEHVAEAVVLSTCNRLEVYAEVTRFHGGVDDVGEALAAATGIPLPELTAHLYVHYEAAAVAHLFAVASGLESMAVGEQQILGQVRSALRAAQDGGSAGRGARRPAPAGAARREARAQRDQPGPGRTVAGRDRSAPRRRRGRSAAGARRCSSSGPGR